MNIGIYLYSTQVHFGHIHYMKKKKILSRRFVAFLILADDAAITVIGYLCFYVNKII